MPVVLYPQEGLCSLVCHYCFTMLARCGWRRSKAGGAMNISTANPIRSHTFTMLVFVIQSSMPGSSTNTST